jgi:hypothetical protein
MTRRTLALSLLLLFLSWVGILSAQSSAPSREQIYGGLTGEWTGQLEYRDFSTDEHVRLPTWLEVKPAADGRSLRFTYTYDDGPTKIVTESSTISIEPATSKFTITSDRNHSSDTYQIQDVKNGTRRMQFTVEGSGKENDKPAEVRITIAIERNLYQFKKETRQAGQEFTFRDGYIFTRRNPAQKAP